MKEVNELLNTEFGNRLRVRVSAMIVLKQKTQLLKPTKQKQ